MKKRSPQGFTLVEILLASALAAFFVVFLFRIMGSFSRGVVNVQRAVPLQRDLQFAKAVIEKDLLSAPRSSIGNAVPDPGFESSPSTLLDSIPTTPGFWACLPRRFRFINRTFGIGMINSRPDLVWNGHQSLLINTRGNVGNYTAFSSTFSLQGRPHLFGAWILSRGTSGAQGVLNLLGDGTAWPTTSLGFLYRSFSRGAPVIPADDGRWIFICRPFNANASFNYRIVGGNASFNNVRLLFAMDDIMVTPLTWMMNNTVNESITFDNFVGNGPAAGQRVRMRYRWAPLGASGQILREIIDPTTGLVLQTLDPLKNIRQMSVAWDFGQATPGVLPALLSPGFPVETTETAWDAFFANGMNFPLAITLQAGNVGALPPQVLSISFSVFPEMP
jgi:hypothetical protein